MMNTDRDTDIARRYRGGEPIGSLQKRFKLSKSRLFQILKRAGVRPPAREKRSRDLFLGINISEPVKDALLIEADKRGVSMSSLSAESLKEMLIACGYPLEAEKVGA